MLLLMLEKKRLCSTVMTAATFRVAAQTIPKCLKLHSVQKSHSSACYCSSSLSFPTLSSPCPFSPLLECRICSNYYAKRYFGGPCKAPAIQSQLASLKAMQSFPNTLAGMPSFYRKWDVLTQFSFGRGFASRLHLIRGPPKNTGSHTGRRPGCSSMDYICG